jgi:ubiquinone/menaquinone biosynthesis C-methylase UbiE
VDVGCGSGAAVRDASGLVERAVGLDLSPAMVARARTLAEGLRNVEFREGDASGRLPFADGEVTALLCTTAFHHFPNPRAAGRELARVLAPGAGS